MIADSGQCYSDSEGKDEGLKGCEECNGHTASKWWG